MDDQQKDASSSLEKKPDQAGQTDGKSGSSASASSPKADQEEVVTIPKSQIQLLYAQINDLAKSVAEKEKQAQSSSASSASTGSTTSISNQVPRPAPGSPTKHHTPRTSRKTGPLSSHVGAVSVSVAGSTLTPDDIKSLLDSLPVYTGSLGECFKWWAQQLESFCKTFNLKMNQIEHHIPQQLIRGRALERYREVQREVNSNNSSSSSSTGKTEPTAEGSTTAPSSMGTWHRRALPWYVLTKELSKLDNPVLRSIYIHEQIQGLRKATLHPSITSTSSTNPNASMIDEQAVTALVTKFRKLESQLDPAPLGDRLFLIVDCVLPEARDMILDKISVDTSFNTLKPGHGHASISKPGSMIKQHLIFNNVDEICDFILIHLGELIKSIHSSATSVATATVNANAAMSSASSSGSASPSPDVHSLSDTSGQGHANAPLCNYCNKPGHLANKCFKRKKNRQREKVKLYDSMQLQHQQQTPGQGNSIANPSSAGGSIATLIPSKSASTVDAAAVAAADGVAES